MPSELVPTDLENMKMTTQELIHRKTINVSHSFILNQPMVMVESVIVQPGCAA
jgi:hypothetical protein